MGKFIYMLTFAASLSPTYRDAADNSRRALMETDMMKVEMSEFQNDAERNLYNYTGLEKDDLAYAVYAYPIFSGKLSTKPFKNLKLESNDHWTLRPEIEYTFSGGSTNTALILLKEF